MSSELWRTATRKFILAKSHCFNEGKTQSQVFYKFPESVEPLQNTCEQLI